MSVRINSLVFQTVLFCIASIFVGLLALSLTLQYSYHVILVLIMGALAGVALGYFSEKRILKSIEQKGEYSSRVSFSLALVLFILMLWLFYAIVFYRELYFPADIGGLVLLFFIPTVPVSFATQSRIVWQWQRKNQKKIIDGRKAIYAVLPSQWPPKIEGSG